MAPSATTTTTTAVESITNGVGKVHLNNKTDPNDVRFFLLCQNHNTQCERSVSRTKKGPSYPYYYPYFDVNEKFPPTEIFGK